MKTETIKKAILASAVLMAAGYAGGAAAHSNGTTITGALAGATDKFTLACPAGTASVYVDLDYIIATGNAANPGILTLTVVKGTAGARLVFDDTRRPLIATPNPGAGGYVNGGAGNYDILVSRSTSGSASYIFTYHCVSTASPPDAATALANEVAGTPTAPLPNPLNQ